jgi:DUF4097 and DUF4098 domain-containing protein YvlB
MNAEQKRLARSVRLHRALVDLATVSGDVAITLRMHAGTLAVTGADGIPIPLRLEEIRLALKAAAEATGAVFTLEVVNADPSANDL